MSERTIDPQRELQEARKKNRAAELERVRALTCQAAGHTGTNDELERCNRIAGHAGPHRVIDPYSFATIREWVT